MPFQQESKGEKQEEREDVPIVVIGTVSGLVCFVVAVVLITYYYKCKRKRPLKVDHSSSVVFTSRNFQNGSNNDKEIPSSIQSSQPLELISPIYESMVPPSMLRKLPEPPKVFAQYEDISSTPDNEDCSTAQISSNIADRLTENPVSPQKETCSSPSKENIYENSKASITKANHMKRPVHIEVI